MDRKAVRIEADLEGRLRSLRLPEPPPGLRSRTLERAGGALGPGLTLTERLWISPWLRLSWAAALITIVLLEAAAGSGGPLSPQHGVGPGPGMRRPDLATAAIEAGLDPLSAETLAARVAEGGEPRGLDRREMLVIEHLL